MNTKAAAQDYRKSSSIAFRDQSQATLDAGGTLPAETQRQLAGYQLVADPAHPNGKLVPLPDHSLRTALGRFGLMVGAGMAGAGAAGAFSGASAAPAASGGGSLLPAGGTGMLLDSGGHALLAAGTHAGTGALMSGATASTLGAAGINGAFQYAGGKRQAKAADTAAQAQLTANNNALQFQREQAEAAYRTQEAAQHANYDQWAARERRLGSVGAILGFGPREIPAYVGGPDPQFTGAGPSSRSAGQALLPGGPSSPAGPIDPNARSSFATGPIDPAIAAEADTIVKHGNLSFNQTDQRANQAIVDGLNAKGYHAQLAPLDSNGHSAGIVVNGRIYQTMNGNNQYTGLQPFDQGGSARPPARASVGSYLTPFVPTPVTPPLPSPYRSVGSYLG